MFVGDPPSLAGKSGAVSSGVTLFFPWVPMCMRLCVCPPAVECLFPSALWKSWGQTPLPSEPESLGPLQLPEPQLGNLLWDSEFSLLWENFCGIIVFQFMGCPPSLYGICFYYDWAPLPSCCSFFFVFGCRVYFFGKFQHFFVGCLSAVSCDFGVSIRRGKLTSFYLAILSLKFYYYFNFLYSVFWKLP